MKDKHLELMEKAPVHKAILTLALPTVSSSIATLLYNLADTYFVGLLDDVYQLGAVSLAYPVFIIMQAIGSMTNPAADIVTTIVAVLLVISPLQKLLKAAKETK